MAMEEITTHIFASLYTFSDAAKHEILEQFESSLVARRAECEQDADVGVITPPKPNLKLTLLEQFIIKCAKEDDQALLVFIDVLQKYIETELDRELDIFEETKITRLPGTLRRSTGSDPDDPKVNTQLVKTQLDNLDNVDGTNKLLINHESVIKRWNPANVNGDINVGLNFNADLLNQVGNITNCRVELDMDEMSIVVRGESQQGVDKALAKLNVLNKSTVCRTSLGCIFEFFIPEGDMDVLLQMLPLKESLGRKLSTTLLSTDSPHTKGLQNYLTIEMISEGGFDLQRKVRPRASSRAGCLLWRSRPYKKYGDGSYSAHIYNNGPGATPQSIEESDDRLAKPMIRTVDQWVEQSAAAADNPFVPLGPAEEPPKVDNLADELHVETDRLVSRARHVKTRKAKGIQPLPDLAQSAATSVVSDSTSISPPKSDSKAGEELGSRKTGDSSSTGPSLADVVIAFRHLDPPPIEPPFMPEPSVASSGSHQITRAKWEAHIVSNVQADTSLLGFDPNEPPEKSSKAEDSQGVKHGYVDERVQPVNEVDTRQIRRTMNQHKASTQVGSGNAALLRCMESRATQILQSARSCTGHVQLEVNLGRILVNHQTGAAEFKRQPFLPGQWPRVFPTEEGNGKLETVFTEMLTTSPTDTDFIINIKLPSGRKLFDEEPSVRKVTYQFFCKTKAGEELVVEVDEEGKSKVRSSPKLVGALNWHFPKREWDARLSVTSYGYLGDKYHDEVKGLITNLQISPSSDGTTLGLFTKTNTTELRIRSIMLCRETYHYSPVYSDVLLRLKEVQDLSVWQMTGKRQEYHASAKSQSEMANEGKLWWEVALSSMAAAAILEENDKLEIGELAKWEANDLVSIGVVKDLSSSAKELVTRIDTVGYYNKGPKAGSGPRTSDRVMKDAGFW